MLPTLLLLLACRPDPGDPSYPDPAAEDTGETDEDGFLEGPDPYEEGEDRLVFGAFYEGEASEAMPVDDVTRHYYIYVGTYTQSVDLIDRVEGYESAVIEHAGGKWWGGGINWDAAEDLSAWTTLHVSFKSRSETYDVLTIGLTGGGEEAVLSASTYGWAADGEWHHLAVPLSDFEDADADLGSVTAPFVLGGGPGEAGDELRVDNLYFTAE